MIKLSVKETKWSSLLARTRALILYISIWICDFGPEKLPGLSRNGPLPSKWKKSNVTPFHKKGEATDKNNYRPVSALSAVSKLFEKVMFDQLYTSFASNISRNMSGFLKGHSCATALIKLTDHDWRHALDEKKDVSVAAIDLSEAFDCICHNLLLAKLKP